MQKKMITVHLTKSNFSDMKLQHTTQDILEDAHHGSQNWGRKSGQGVYSKCINTCLWHYQALPTILTQALE